MYDDFLKRSREVFSQAQRSVYAVPVGREGVYDMRNSLQRALNVVFAADIGMVGNFGT